MTIYDDPLMEHLFMMLHYYADEARMTPRRALKWQREALIYVSVVTGSNAGIRHMRRNICDEMCAAMRTWRETEWVLS